MTETRALYSADSLRRLFEPKSVAIVGASSKPGTIGNQVLMQQAATKARIYPINPSSAEINGITTYPDLKSLPEAPDCVILATGRASIEGLLADCAAVGAGGVVVFASGFAEMGSAEFIDQQTRIVAVARSHNLPLLGPNCIGFANIAASAYMTFVPVVPQPIVNARAIGVVSQSGALGFGIAQAAVRGVSFSHIMASGNACDVDAADIVNYLAQAPECRAIVCLLEGLKQPERMVDAARAARLAGKPLVISAVGRSEGGKVSALAHTASVAGALDPLKALLQAEGVIFVADPGRLIETAQFLLKAGKARIGRGVATIATSGGACILTADAAADHAIAQPQPSDALLAKLRAFIPDFVILRNPCDVTAQTSPAGFNDCVTLFGQSGEYGAIVVPQTASWQGAATRIKGLAAVAEALDIPVCVVWISEDVGGETTHVIEGSKLCLFRSMDRCFGTLAAWADTSVAKA